MLVASSAADIRSLTMAPLMACTSSSARASSSRSRVSEPPASALLKSCTSVSRCVSAVPLSRTILRKKKSMPWMEVVPS